MKTIHDVQSQQQAGHTKLTAVSIYSNGKKHVFFANLLHDDRGRAILPKHILNRELARLRVQCGQIYSVGS